jgi:hypothetical protein
MARWLGVNPKVLFTAKPPGREEMIYMETEC